MKYLATIGIVLVALAALIVAPSCSSWSKVTSPYSGREVTADELAAEKQADDAQAREDAAAAKLEAQTAERQAALAREKAKAEFGRAVARIQAETNLQLDDLTATYEIAQAEADARTAALLDSFAARVASIEARTTTKTAAASAALEQLAAKQARIETLLGGVEKIAGGFGPGGMLVSSVLGLGGLLFGVKKARDQKSTEDAVTRVVDAIDAVKLADPNVAQAFKTHAKVLAEWMGPSGVAIVNKAQNS